MHLFSSFKTLSYKYFQTSNLIDHDVLFYSYLKKLAGSYSDNFHDILKLFSIDLCFSYEK
jgi:hypothetical protein